MDIFFIVGLVSGILFIMLALISDRLVFNDASRIYLKKNGRKLDYFSILDKANLGLQGVFFKVLLNNKYLDEEFTKRTVVMTRLTILTFLLTIVCSFMST